MLVLLVLIYMSRIFTLVDFIPSSIHSIPHLPQFSTHTHRISISIHSFIHSFIYLFFCKKIDTNININIQVINHLFRHLSIPTHTLIRIHIRTHHPSFAILNPSRQIRWSRWSPSLPHKLYDERGDNADTDKQSRCHGCTFREAEIREHGWEPIIILVGTFSKKISMGEKRKERKKHTKKDQ